MAAMNGQRGGKVKVCGRDREWDRDRTLGQRNLLDGKEASCCCRKQS